MTDVNDLSPAALEELDKMCAKMNKDKKGNHMSKKDQLFFIERKIIDQVFSHIEQCEAKRLAEIWGTIHNGNSPDEIVMFNQIEQHIDGCSRKQLQKLYEFCIGETDLGTGFLSIVNAKEVKI